MSLIALSTVIPYLLNGRLCGRLTVSSNTYEAFQSIHRLSFVHTVMKYPPILLYPKPFMRFLFLSRRLISLKQRADGVIIGIRPIVDIIGDCVEA